MTRLPHRRRQGARGRALHRACATRTCRSGTASSASSACRRATTRSASPCRTRRSSRARGRPRLPPTRDDLAAAHRRDVHRPRPGAAARADPRRARSRACAVGGPSRRFRWKLTRLGSIRPLRRGQGQRAHARLPRPGRRADRRLHAGRRGRGPPGHGTDRRARGRRRRPSWSSCRRSPGRAATRSTATATGSTRRSTTRARSGVDRARSPTGARPRGSPPQVAPLMRFLGRRDYDLTTDLALARGQRPEAARVPGAACSRATSAGCPPTLNRRLRAYVQGGGKVASFGARRVPAPRHA